jgi:hypothetical protein
MTEVPEVTVCEICGRYSDDEDSFFCGKDHRNTLQTFLPRSLEESLVQTKKSHLLTIEPASTNLNLRSLIVGNLLTRVDLSLEESLISSLKSQLQSLPQIDLILKPFILRPMMITASSLSKLDNFHETLTRRKIELSFPEVHGEIIHRLFGDCFPIEKVETDLVIKGQALTVHCRADGSWIHTTSSEESSEQEDFVIELKTVRRIESITSAKLESWLLQIACYQLAYEAITAPTTSTGTSTMKKNVLLMVLDVGHVPYKSYVYQVSRDNVLRAVRSAWTHWFRNHQKELKECFDYQRRVRTLSDIVTPPPRVAPTVSAKSQTQVVTIAASNAFSSLLEDNSEEEEEEEEQEQEQEDSGGGGKDSLEIAVSETPALTSLDDDQGQVDDALRKPTVVEAADEDLSFQEVTKKKKKDKKPTHRGSSQKQSHRR